MSWLAVTTFQAVQAIRKDLKLVAQCSCKKKTMDDSTTDIELFSLKTLLDMEMLEIKLETVQVGDPNW